MKTNYLTRLCETCGREFSISKFQPYIKNCKEHRSKKTITKNKNKRKRHQLKSCCSNLFENMLSKKCGIVFCEKCNKMYWKVKDNRFRSYHRHVDGKYWIYDTAGNRTEKYEGGQI